MAAAGPYFGVTPEERLLKKRREAEALRGVPPGRTVDMGFQMMRFAAKVRKATRLG